MGAILLGPFGVACATSPAEPTTVLRVDQRGLNQRLTMATATPADTEAPAALAALTTIESTKASEKPTTSDVKTPPSEDLESIRDGRREEFVAREKRRMGE